jgi:hypothetical protein
VNEPCTDHPDTVTDLVAKTLEVDGDELEVEYEDGYEIVYAIRGGQGIGIAELRSNSQQAEALRRRLEKLARRAGIVSIQGTDYRLKVTRYESFGETAYRVAVKRA